MGGCGRKPRAATLPLNLPALQNLIKRDPASYEAEFQLQYRHFAAACDLLRIDPTHVPEGFGELCSFLAHTCTMFPEGTETVDFSERIFDMLGEERQAAALVDASVAAPSRMPLGWVEAMDAELRRTLVSCAVLLRNRNVVSSQRMLALFFSLFRCRDKQLRALLHRNIVHDIRALNQKHKNNKLNRVLQNFMFQLLENADNGAAHALAAKKAMEICVDLYRKGVWNDSKTINVLASAVFSPVYRISMTAVHFFLNADEKDESRSSDEEDLPDLERMRHQQKVGGKSKRRTNQLDKAVAQVKRKERRQNAESGNAGFLAIHQINDAQGFADRLQRQLSSNSTASKLTFDMRLLQLRLLARVIGLQRLYVPGFFSYTARYLQPHQEQVTTVLASVAQATHELSMPEDVETIIRVIADRFVTDTVSNEVIGAGLNAIREICARQPLGMSADLLDDLTEYKNHRAKGVFMAARSLIGLFRDLNPLMLKKKNRGKGVSVAIQSGEMSTDNTRFGEVKIADGVEGAELLDQDDAMSVDGDEAGSAAELEDDDDAWAGWEFETIGQGREHVSGEECSSVESGDEASHAGESTATEHAPKVRPELTKFLTDDDFKRIRALKLQQKVDALSGTKRKNPSMDDIAEDSDDEGEDHSEFVSETTIIGQNKRAKQDYDERMASIMAGREGREKFGSKRGNTERGSTTNKEKAKKKNYMMVIHKWQVTQKSKMSLRDRSKKLRKHAKNQKSKH